MKLVTPLELDEFFPVCIALFSEVCYMLLRQLDQTSHGKGFSKHIQGSIYYTINQITYSDY